MASITSEKNVSTITDFINAWSRLDLPCTGVFEMEDGKIKVWRDYFDLATFSNAMS